MSDSVLRLWISDHIYKLVGLSDKTMVDYVYVLATSSKNKNDLYNSLLNLDIPQTSGLKQFADELYSRVPHKTKTIKKESQERKNKEKETINLLQKNSSYKLLMDDSDDEEEEHSKIKKKHKHKRKHDKSEDTDTDSKRKKHIRRKRKEDRDKEWETDSEEERRISSAIQDTYHGKEKIYYSLLKFQFNYYNYLN